MLLEYGRVVRDAGRKEDALKLMYQAASKHKRLEAMVSLFADIGMLCESMAKNEEARAHLVLCRYVREENDWSVPEKVLNGINELTKIIGNSNEPKSLKEALSICRVYWQNLLGEKSVSISKAQDKRKIRKGLLGKVRLGKEDSNFCFIVTKDDESFFCLKNDLPPDIKDTDKVTFNAIPSFDKKKNKKSWRARNIQFAPPPGGRGQILPLAGPRSGKFRYKFLVDGVQAPDPVNSLTIGTSSLVLVPGKETEFFTVRNVPHGTVQLAKIGPFWGWSVRGSVRHIWA